MWDRKAERIEKYHRKTKKDQDKKQQPKHKKRKVRDKDYGRQ
jgi:hypothetical protein|tara:strand:+ start:246 stop:371 length:126 start_codon:yes stop_codon:yes gene_type:complete